MHYHIYMITYGTSFFTPISCTGMMVESLRPGLAQTIDGKITDIYEYILTIVLSEFLMVLVTGIVSGFPCGRQMLLDSHI